MDLVLQSQDYLMLIIIPLMFVTAKQVYSNWNSLWDARLTERDRRILLQAALFLLEPIVVLLHELGHALAIWQFGGTVQEFHFAILSGWVRPYGNFTALQLFIIYLAGNALEVLIGYLLIFVAYFCRPPAVVATLVYLGIWSIVSCAILYPLLSILGVYGDWSAIYKESLVAAPQLKPVVFATGFVHGMVVASIFYMLKGTQPRLWFAKKTRPEWSAQFEKLFNECEETPTHENLLKLAWLYYEASLDDLASKALERSIDANPNDAEPYILRGWLMYNRGDLDKAENIFKEASIQVEASPVTRARAYMAIADCYLAKGGKNSSDRLDPDEARKLALRAYSAAGEAAPDLADPHVHKAVMLNKLKKYREALIELQNLADKKWLDKSLVQRVSQEEQVAIKGAQEEQ